MINVILRSSVLGDVGGGGQNASVAFFVPVFLFDLIQFLKLFVVFEQIEKLCFC